MDPTPTCKLWGAATVLSSELIQHPEVQPLVLRWLAGFDRLTAASRPAWGWIGELSLIVLGIHLAADRLDDLLLIWLSALQLPWPAPDFPQQLATWTAVGVELHVVIWAAWMLFRSRAEAVDSPRAWLDRFSIHAALCALAWAPLALVGSWVLAMAFEDLVAPWLGQAALYLSWGVAVLAAWRLGWHGWVRVTTRVPEPRKKIEGWLAAPTVILVAVLGAVYGLPIRGLIDQLSAAGLF